MSAAVWGHLLWLLVQSHTCLQIPLQFSWTHTLSLWPRSQSQLDGGQYGNLLQSRLRHFPQPLKLKVCMRSIGGWTSKTKRRQQASSPSPYHSPQPLPTRTQFLACLIYDLLHLYPSHRKRIEIHMCPPDSFSARKQKNSTSLPKSHLLLPDS